MPKQITRRVRIVRQTIGQTSPSPKPPHGQARQIGVKLAHPNQLFERWLEDMLSKAEDSNSMSRIPLQKALASLRRYPLPICSGRDCCVLMDFGTGICEALEKKLQSYRRNGGKLTVNLDIEIENELNDGKKEYYDQLLSRETAESVENKLEGDQFEMPDDSVFENLDVIDSQYLNISNPKAILLVDTQETIGKSKSNLDRTLKELEQHNVVFEVRRLSVGDFLWIIRDDSGKDFILPYIIERKRMDDLASSIKDGRFHEQKFRLKQCGLANVIYLIEHLGNNRQVGVPASTLSQAALNTYVQNFTVKYTENHHHTVLYLSAMTKFLNKNITGKSFRNITNQPQATVSTPGSDFNLNQRTIPLLSFESFNKQSSKTRECSIKEIFMKQLLQIKLLTIEKVNAIVEKYPTPKKLFMAYERCTSEDEKEQLLNLTYGPLKRTIGLKLSKIIYHLFMSDTYQH